MGEGVGGGVGVRGERGGVERWERGRVGRDQGNGGGGDEGLGSRDGRVAFAGEGAGAGGEGRVAGEGRGEGGGITMGACVDMSRGEGCDEPRNSIPSARGTLTESATSTLPPAPAPDKSTPPFHAAVAATALPNSTAVSADIDDLMRQDAQSSPPLHPRTTFTPRAPPGDGPSDRGPPTRRSSRRGMRVG